MKTYRILVAALIVVTMVGCTREEQVGMLLEHKSFTGQVEARLDSRVILNGSNTMEWVVNDRVSIFPCYEINHLHKVVNVENGVADFGYPVSYDEEQAENPIEIDYNYAVYPYNEANSLSNGVISTIIPGTMEYTGKENSIMYNLLVAKSSSNSLIFTNAQGMLCLKLNAQQAFKYGPVKYIKLESATKPLSGLVTIDFSSAEKPCAVVASDGDKSLTVNLSEEFGNKIPAAQNNEFMELYIPIVTGSYIANDLTMYIYWADDTKTPYSKFIGTEFTINRHEVYTLSHTIKGDSFDGQIDNDAM